MTLRPEHDNEPMVQRVEYVHDTDQWLYNKRAPFPGAALAPLRLPGLRGFYAAPFDQESKAWPNLGGVSGLSLSTIIAGATAAVEINGTWPGAIVPYMATYFAGNWLYVQSAALAEITGSLTVGVWVQLKTLTNTQNIIWASGATPTPLVWGLICHSTAPDLRFSVAIDNTTLKTVTSSTSPAVDTWYFICGRYTPSNEVKIWVNEATDTSISSVPASIWIPGVNPYFQIFPTVGFTEATCPRVAQGWVCAYAVPDAVIDWLYKIQAPLFGKV